MYIVYKYICRCIGLETDMYIQTKTYTVDIDVDKVDFDPYVDVEIWASGCEAKKADMEAESELRSMI